MLDEVTTCKYANRRNPIEHRHRVCRARNEDHIDEHERMVLADLRVRSLRALLIHYRRCLPALLFAEADAPLSMRVLARTDVAWCRAALEEIPVAISEAVAECEELAAAIDFGLRRN